MQRDWVTSGMKRVVDAEAKWRDDDQYFSRINSYLNDLRVCECAYGIHLT
jgi:hypothetical protein